MYLSYYKFLSSFLNLLFWDINMNIFLLPLLRNNRACGHWLLTTLQVKAKLDSLQFSSWSSLQTGISNLSSASNIVLGMNFSRESLADLNTTVWVVVCPVFVFASTQDFFLCQFLWWDVILRGLRGIFQTEKSSYNPISMKGADYAPPPLQKLLPS